MDRLGALDEPRRERILGAHHPSEGVLRIASTTRVCAYDRAGRGWSEPATGSLDGADIARDLRALLAASGDPGPYILAGHSSGGVYVRFFAAAYPDEVAGVVLLDAQSPHLTPASAAGQDAEGPMRTVAGMLPARRHAHEVTPQGVASFGDEFVQLDGILDAVSGLPDLGDLPLVVVTAAAEPPDGWLDQQDRLATLSTDASHRDFRPRFVLENVSPVVRLWPSAYRKAG